MQPILDILPDAFAKSLSASPPVLQRSLRELRLRAGRPALALGKGEEYRFGPFGLCKGDGLTFTVSHAQEVWRRISSHSGYTLLEGQRRGFVPLPGGHRVGLCGETASEGGRITNFLHLCSFCVRIAHEVKGCALPVAPLLREGRQVCSTLIISPPGMGKTTLLRDLARLFSGEGYNVALSDERGELAACLRGEPLLDVGPRTDVLTGAGKGEGLEMLVRSMAPDILITDELSGEDIPAAQNALHAGIALLASAHGDSAQSVLQKPCFAPLAQENAFSRFVLLGGGIGQVREVLDSGLRPLGRVTRCC